MKTKHPSYLIAGIVMLALSGCTLTDPCTIHPQEWEITSVYYQPKSFGASEEWSGKAEDGKHATEYSIIHPVEVGQTIYWIPAECGYFAHWRVDLDLSSGLK